MGEEGNDDVELSSRTGAAEPHMAKLGITAAAHFPGIGSMRRILQ
jgi:hypothetical protein